MQERIFNKDKNLAVTYGSLDITKHEVDELEYQIVEANSNFHYGSLKLFGGHDKGVCIHSKISIDTAYDHSGHFDNEIDNIANYLKEATPAAISYAEANTATGTDDYEVKFIECVVDAVMHKLSGSDGLLRYTNVSLIVQDVLSTNETLGYNFNEQGERLDLIAGVLKTSYWKEVVESAIFAIKTELEDAALHIALNNNLKPIAQKNIGGS